MNIVRAIVLTLAICVAAPIAMTALPASAQTAASDPTRDATRENLRALLAVQGPKIGVAFRQSTKNPYNFVGSLTQNLKNCDYLEIVISVTAQNTIGFRVYPHYKGGYINLSKVINYAAYTRKLLFFSDDNFLFGGADSEGDSFFGYTFTLESGFPEAAINIVLASLKNQDQFVGELRPAIDGSAVQ